MPTGILTDFRAFEDFRETNLGIPDKNFPKILEIPKSSKQRGLGMNEPDIVLDCRGQLCPQPIIELAKRITDVAPGGLIAVVADDPAAAADVPAWCRLRGHTYEGKGDDTDGFPSYLVRRTAERS